MEPRTRWRIAWLALAAVCSCAAGVGCNPAKPESIDGESETADAAHKRVQDVATDADGSAATAEVGHGDGDLAETETPDAAPHDADGACPVCPFCDPCPEFINLGSWPLDADGRSKATAVTVTMPSGVTAALLRVTGPGGAAVTGCIRSSNPQQAATPGYALVRVGAWPDLKPQALVSLAVVDCATGLGPLAVKGTELAFEPPTSLLVHSFPVSDPPNDQLPSLKARLHVHPAALPSESSQTTLQLALGRAVQALAAAGVKLQATVSPALGLPPTTVSLAPSAAGLNVLAAGLGEAGGIERSGVPVLVVPCLRRVNTALKQDVALAGWTTRVPGGLPRAGVADLVVVSTGNCAGAVTADADGIGWRIAHELGHWLGLQHPVEADGTGRELPGLVGHKGNLMATNPVGNGGLELIAAQKQILRRHPALAK